MPILVFLWVNDPFHDIPSVRYIIVYSPLSNEFFWNIISIKIRRKFWAKYLLKIYRSPNLFSGCLKCQQTKLALISYSLKFVKRLEKKLLIWSTSQKTYNLLVVLCGYNIFKVCLRMMQSMKICWVTLKFLWSKIKKNVNTWKELQYTNEQGYFKK